MDGYIIMRQIYIMYLAVPWAEGHLKTKENTEEIQRYYLNYIYFKLRGSDTFNWYIFDFFDIFQKCYFFILYTFLSMCVHFTTIYE